MAPFHILSPVAPSRVDERALASRLTSLAGRRVALLDNQKANAALLLATVGRHLTDRHPDLVLVSERKMATSSAPAEVMARLHMCDAVVLAIAD